MARNFEEKKEVMNDTEYQEPGGNIHTYTLQLHYKELEYSMQW